MSAISWLLPRRVAAVFLQQVVGVHPGNVPGGGIALGGQEGPVVLHVEHRLGGVHNPPDHNGPDDDGIAPLVVDGLLLVVQGHGLQRNLPAAPQAHAGGAVNGGHGGGRCSGIDPLTEGVHPEKTVLFQGSVILAEQGEYQCLVGIEYLQPRHKEKVQHQHQNSQNQQRYHSGHIGPRQKHRTAHQSGYACHQQQQHHKQHGKAVQGLHRFFGVPIDQFLLVFHETTPPLGF